MHLTNFCWFSFWLVWHLAMLTILVRVDITMADEAATAATAASVWGRSYCPTFCVCERRLAAVSQEVTRTADCSNHGMKELPANMSADTQTLLLAANHIRMSKLSKLQLLTKLTELNMADNHIYSLEYCTVALPSLRYLVLDGNQIDYLGDRTFSRMPALRYLSMANNKIELMHVDALRDTTALRTLLLRGNRIFSMEALWFRDLENLTVLDLRDNNIHVLRDGDFVYLSQLTQLNLANNQLIHIYDGAFVGLASLSQLSLQSNHLKAVPIAALQRLSRLSVLNLSNNHLVRLLAASFRHLNLSVLRLSDIGVLRLIDSGAFADLPLLESLDVSGCKALEYIDRAAFSALPRLDTLLVHGNNLSVLEREVIESLPAIATLSLHHNPLACDCQTNWIVESIAQNKPNVTWVNAIDIVCASPGPLRGRTMVDMATATAGKNDLRSECGPRVLPLFGSNYNAVLGDQISLDCRAVGIPIPKMDWLLPAHISGDSNDEVEVLKTGTQGSTSASGHIQVDVSGTLRIAYVQGPDHGQYTCLATSPRGRDERTAQLSVRNMRANVIIIGVTPTSVKVTWRASHYLRDYQILYRRSGAAKNDTYHSIDIEPYMRSYTASELSPDTPYDFCLAVKHEQQSVRINCTVVSTRSTEELGVVDVRGYIVGGGMAVLVVTVAIVCTLTILIKRYNRRKRQQEELYSDNLSQLFLASMDSMSDTTPITYENRIAEMFDDDDIEEIRSTASMPSTSASTAIR